jgi:hypothetical protein
MKRTASHTKTKGIHCGTILVIQFLCSLHLAQAQVNSGSNGSDGAFHPTTNTVINMADHPDGIYHYKSVHSSKQGDVVTEWIGA